MTGKDLALAIIQRYGTTDVLSISQQAGVKVNYGRWEAVTYGEFDKKTLSIYINLNAPVATTEILAHELGHYFIHQSGIQWLKQEEEKIVEDFVRVIQTHFP